MVSIIVNLVEGIANIAICKATFTPPLMVKGASVEGLNFQEQLYQMDVGASQTTTRRVHIILIGKVPTHVSFVLRWTWPVENVQAVSSVSVNVIIVYCRQTRKSMFKTAFLP